MAQSQNSISMAPSANGIDPIVVTGHYMDAPNDLSQAATGFNYAPFAAGATQINIYRVLGQFAAIAAGGSGGLAFKGESGQLV